MAMSGLGCAKHSVKPTSFAQTFLSLEGPPFLAVKFSQFGLLRGMIIESSCMDGWVGVVRVTNGWLHGHLSEV